MQKNIAISPEFHKTLKLAALQANLNLGQYIEHIVDSQKRLSLMARELSHMKKGDVYSLDIGNKLIVLQAEAVHGFEQMKAYKEIEDAE
jgi:hypothetical protein